MTSRHLYAERRFTTDDAVAAAIDVLATYADAVECGDADDREVLVRPREDRSGLDRAVFTWMTFSVGGRELGGWSRGDGDEDPELLVFRPGPWDDALDEIPHRRDPWSWIQVDLQVSRPRGSVSLMGCLRSSWDPAQLMALLDPLGIDYVVVSILPTVGRRPVSRSSGTLLVERLAPPATATESDVRSWWTRVFEDLREKYRLDSAGWVPYTDEDEGYLRVTHPDGSLPDEETLDTLSEAVTALGATTDDWFEDGSAMNLPVSGAGLAGLVERAALAAREMGLSVVDVEPSPGSDAPR
ncbi:hypothetical protein [Janibacter sp. G368]|uniref:hypothetical protein n=1 Tax=Janibacter sp. G368 TaxID=3420441 RepID=UPI003D004F87